MRTLITLSALALVLVAVFALAEEEAELKKSDVPEAVLMAFAKAQPNAVITEYTREVIDGQTRYEIETRVGKIEKDYVYMPDGTLLQIDEDMSVKSLPQVVVQSITSAYPNCELEEADKITRGSTLEYEVVIEIEDGSHEVEYALLVSADGRILSATELVEADDDEDEEDNDDGEDEENDEEDDD